MRLGEAEAADGFALLKERQPFIFLRVGAKGVDRIHHQRRLHGHEAAQSGIAALEFLRDESVFDVGHARAAVAFQARAEKPEFGHLRNKLHGKFSFAIVLLDDGHDFSVDELPRGLAGESFFVAQERIEVEVIDSGERWHPISPCLKIACGPKDAMPDRKQFAGPSNRPILSEITLGAPVYPS